MEHARTIRGLLGELIEAILRSQPEKLKDLVHKTEGLYVDFKAHWSYARLVKEIASQKGYLYETIFSKEDSASVYHILQSYKEISLKLYFYRQDSKELCEVVLSNEAGLDTGYPLHNPVFIKKKGKWYVFRFL